MTKLSRALCITGLSLSLLLATSSFVFAQSHGGPHGGPHGNAPEPVSCLLLLAGGCALAGLRRLKNNKKKSNNQ